MPGITTHYIKTKEYGKLSFKVTRTFNIGNTLFLQSRPLENCLPINNHLVHYISDKGLSMCFERASTQSWLTVTHNKSWMKILPVLLIENSKKTEVFTALDTLVHQYNWKQEATAIQNEASQGAIKSCLLAFRKDMETH